MTIFEERQILELERDQIIREISSRREGLEQLALMVVLKDLQEKLDDLEQVNSFFDQ